jgi:nucleotide-binding universal stress UspA family protein
MNYKTLMAHLELGRSNAGVLRIAGALADRFDATIVGVAASQPMQVYYAEAYVTGAFIDAERSESEKERAEAEAEFGAALQTRSAKFRCRADITGGTIADYLAREARCADLIITAADTDKGGDFSRRADLGDLIMQAGRPVLVVPAGADAVDLDRVVVAWKDAPEARRTVCNALPVLKGAGHVCLVEVAHGDELEEARARLDDVALWLARHGVVAECLASRSAGDDAARLDAIAAERGAGLVVAGAYGHSRLREWVLGGVTHDLVMRPVRPMLVSH